jgi:DNA-binding GntR family transcriptional regulator
MSGTPRGKKKSGKVPKQQQAYEFLKKRIITGKYPPGKLLLEREICEALQISRTPVREALRRLTSDGLVESSSGRGLYVTRLTLDEFLAIYELKEALETKAACLCIQRMDNRDLMRMRACLYEHRQAFANRDYELTADRDLEFHVLLVECARSPKIEEYAKTILAQTRRLSELSVFDSSHTHRFIAQHEAIYEAIKGRDPELATRAVLDHIQAIREFQSGSKAFLQFFM